MLLAADASVWNCKVCFCSVYVCLFYLLLRILLHLGDVCILCALCFCLTGLGQAVQRSAGIFNCFTFLFSLCYFFSFFVATQAVF